jgi:hypothetical protein
LNIEPNFATNSIKLRGYIASNLGMAWNKSGDASRAFLWHKNSLSLFSFHGEFLQSKLMKKKRTIGLEETRQETQLATMYIQFAHKSKTLEWVKLLQEDGDEMTNAKKFLSAEQGGQVLFKGAIDMLDYALSILYLQAYRQKIRADWQGLFVTWCNIGMASCLMFC